MLEIKGFRVISIGVMKAYVAKLINLPKTAIFNSFSASFDLCHLLKIWQNSYIWAF